jgi:hypothetical protein
MCCSLKPRWKSILVNSPFYLFKNINVLYVSKEFLFLDLFAAMEHLHESWPNVSTYISYESVVRISNLTPMTLGHLITAIKILRYLLKLQTLIRFGAS